LNGILYADTDREVYRALGMSALRELS